MQLNVKDVTCEREENCCFISIIFNSQFTIDLINEHYCGKVISLGCQLFYKLRQNVTLRITHTDKTHVSDDKIEINLVTLWTLRMLF